jgi:opacity protein-like surface antigen
MKHSLLIAAAATALLAAPTVASAQDSGVYIKGQAGYGVFTDADLSPSATNVAGFAGEINGEGNLALSLGLGYDFGNGWRTELELSQLYNDMGAISGLPLSSAKLRTTSGMFNALYDFNPCTNRGHRLARQHREPRRTGLHGQRPSDPSPGLRHAALRREQRTRLPRRR